MPQEITEHRRTGRDSFFGVLLLFNLAVLVSSIVYIASQEGDIDRRVIGLGYAMLAALIWLPFVIKREGWKRDKPVCPSCGGLSFCDPRSEDAKLFRKRFGEGPSKGLRGLMMRDGIAFFAVFSCFIALPIAFIAFFVLPGSG
ncbi:MAG: hypothetical protein ACPGYV_05980 [Phycisphaeraceae bacterium]